MRLMSPAQYRNIFSPDLREIEVGIFVSQSSKVGIYWGQNFVAGDVLNSPEFEEWQTNYRGLDPVTQLL